MKIFESQFFKVPENLTHAQLTLYCNLWIPLQSEFTIGTVVLNGKIAEILLHLIRNKPFDPRISTLREILRLQTPAAADEVGVGKIPSIMHDLLFLKQIEDSNVILDSKFFRADPLHDLVCSIESAFKGEVVNGLAMAIVVELMAPRLFEAQYDIFRKAGIEDGLLTHSRIHKHLEEGHAEEANKMVALAEQVFGQKTVDGLMERYAQRWKDFLDYVAEVVYEPVLA